jgi:hypothetical protein
MDLTKSEVDLLDDEALVIYQYYHTQSMDAGDLGVYCSSCTYPTLLGITRTTCDACTDLVAGCLRCYYSSDGVSTLTAGISITQLTNPGGPFCAMCSSEYVLA